MKEFHDINKNSQLPLQSLSLPVPIYRETGFGRAGGQALSSAFLAVETAGKVR